MRLGHINERSLKVLSERDLLCSYVASKLNVCKCCDLDQRWKVQFSIIIKETMKIAELIKLNIHRIR